MATTQARFADKRYPNWIKSSLSLLYLKQGIEGIIDTEAADFHRRLQQAPAVINARPQACSSCTYKSMTRDTHRQMWYMKCRLCNAWLQEIIQNHAHHPLPKLSRENTDPRLWPTAPYEVMKCYMPYGCQRDQSAKDGDIQSLLKLVQNCRHFSRCGKISQKSQGLIDKVLEIRNSLLHSGDFLVDDGKLGNYLDTMLEFLEETSSLTILSDPEKTSVDGAITKIKELKDHELNLSLEKIAIQQMRNAVVKDLQDSDEKTRRELQKVKDMVEKRLEKIEKDIQQQQEKTKALENLTKIPVV